MFFNKVSVFYFSIIIRKTKNMAELMFKVPVEVEPKRDSRFIVEFPTEFNIES